jgi:porin
MDRSETVVELTYRAQISRFFVLQPDVQWVVNPGMNPELADALVFGLRAHLSLELPG